VNKDEGRFTFNIRLADPSPASNLGAMVLSRYEIDTTLGTLLQEITDRFDYWKLNSIALRVVPFRGSTQVGFHGVGILSDPQDTSPVNFTEFINLKQVKVSPIFDMNPIVLKIQPKGPLRWRYTKDQALESDRWEAFGDLLYATASTTEAEVKSIIYAKVDISVKYPVLAALGSVQMSLAGLPNQGDNIVEDEESLDVSTSLKKAGLYPKLHHDVAPMKVFSRK
jgi:hypothetical protein